MAYNASSPYSATPSNGFYLDIMSFRSFPSLDSDMEYEILKQHEHRPDLLAYDLYGDVNLWWVFAVRNKDIIKDPVYDLYAGQKIKIPQTETLRKSLGI